MGVGRLEVLHRGAQMVEQGTQRAFQRRQGQLPALGAGGQQHAQPHAAGGGFQIAFHTGDLSGQEDAGPRLERQVLVQGHGRVHIGVAVHAAEAGEFRLFQTGHHAEHARLLAVGQLGLAAHQIAGLAVEGLGKYTSIASGLFMVMVCGGGILPVVQGAVADAAGFLNSYWVLVVALVYILWFAISGSKVKKA